jgi:hypothetical protein
MSSPGFARGACFGAAPSKSGGSEKPWSFWTTRTAASSWTKRKTVASQTPTVRE